MKKEPELSKRERQIMDIVYQRDEVTVRDVCDLIENAPSYSTVRTIMGILEGKGYLIHSLKGKTYHYRPSVSSVEVGESALARVMNTFYKGSIELAVSGLLRSKETALGDDELERISKMIEAAKAKGK